MGPWRCLTHSLRLRVRFHGDKHKDKATYGLTDRFADKLKKGGASVRDVLNPSLMLGMKARAKAAKKVRETLLG